MSEELQSHLKSKPGDAVVIQALRNTSMCLRENALLLRSMIPGGKPEALKDTKKDGKRKVTASANSEPKVKRRRTGYIAFSQAQRPRTMAANVGMKPTEIMSLLGAAWKALPATERSAWNEQAAREDSDDSASVPAAPPGPVREPVSTHVTYMYCTPHVLSCSNNCSRTFDMPQGAEAEAQQKKKKKKKHDA